jgi:hypothetical protein
MVFFKQHFLIFFLKSFSVVKKSAHEIIWIKFLNEAKALLATCFHAGFSRGLFFDLEDRDDIFLQNVAWLSTDYMALQGGGADKSLAL